MHEDLRGRVAVVTGGGRGLRAGDGRCPGGHAAASDDSRYIVGESIVIDGGYSII
jgi:hypothetical protein